MEFLNGVSGFTQCAPFLKNESFVAFREAVKAGDFTVFNKHMKPSNVSTGALVSLSRSV